MVAFLTPQLVWDWGVVLIVVVWVSLFLCLLLISFFLISALKPAPRTCKDFLFTKTVFNYHIFHWINQSFHSYKNKRCLPSYPTSQSENAYSDLNTNLNFVLVAVIKVLYIFKILKNMSSRTSTHAHCKCLRGIWQQNSWQCYFAYFYQTRARSV